VVAMNEDIEAKEIKEHTMNQANELENYAKLVRAKKFTLDSTTYSEILEQTAITARITYAFTERLEELQKKNAEKDQVIKNLEKRIEQMTKEIETLNQVKLYFQKIASILTTPTIS